MLDLEDPGTGQLPQRPHLPLLLAGSPTRLQPAALPQLSRHLLSSVAPVPVCERGCCLLSQLPALPSSVCLRASVTCPLIQPLPYGSPSGSERPALPWRCRVKVTWPSQAHRRNFPTGNKSFVPALVTSNAVPGTGCPVDVRCCLLKFKKKIFFNRFYYSQQPSQVFPILQMQKLRYGEVKGFLKVTRQNGDSNLGRLPPVHVRCPLTIKIYQCMKDRCKTTTRRPFPSFLAVK